MAEKIFDKQINFGWGLSFNMTGKSPAVAKRIWNTYDDALAYVNDFNDSAIEGLLLSVIADEDDKKNGVYFVQRIKKDENDDDATLIKVGSGDIDEFVENFNSELEQIKKDSTDNKSKLEASIEEVSENLETIQSSIMETIGVIDEGQTIANMLNITNEAIQNINTYTINDKQISQNPTLNSDDLLIGQTYSMLNQTSDNIFPGDIVTNAISKLEVTLANTTLALTAAVNDIESRVGNERIYNEDGELVAEATGLTKQFAILKERVNALSSASEGSTPDCKTIGITDDEQKALYVKILEKDGNLLGVDSENGETGLYAFIPVFCDDDELK
jgi:hypothetical protein